MKFTPATHRPLATSTDHCYPFPMLRIRIPHLFTWLALCLALTVFARALVPVGFMPAAKADGSIHMVICTGDGAKSIDLPASDHAPAPKSGDCLYAPQGLAQHTPITGPTLTAPVAFTRITHTQDTDSTAAVLTAAGFSARAPPALA